MFNEGLILSEWNFNLWLPSLVVWELNWCRLGDGWWVEGAPAIALHICPFPLPSSGIASAKHRYSPHLVPRGTSEVETAATAWSQRRNRTVRGSLLREGRSRKHGDKPQYISHQHWCERSQGENILRVHGASLDVVRGRALDEPSILQDRQVMWVLAPRFLACKVL